ncbi:MAG: hypothetical protein RBT35_08065 [Bacteroidales bacterium]|jgi:hypothetical protein|nr:hypothetical protein [Bacteroidales bacterium]
MSESDSRRFRITFSGEIKEGYTKEQVQTYLAGVYKTTPGKITHLFSGKAYVLKRDADLETIRKYNRVFSDGGAIIRIQENTPVNLSPMNRDESDSTHTSISKDASEKLGSLPIKRNLEIAYKGRPEEESQDSQFEEDGEMETGSDEENTNEVQQGFNLFRKRPDLFETIIDVVQGIFGLLFSALYILGVYHSYTKHPNDLGIVRWSPYAVYRGVEFFWHDDFAGVNWEERLRDDANKCIRLLNRSYSEDIDQAKFDKAIEEYKKTLKKYPEDRIEVLRIVSQNYIKHSNSFFRDIFRAIDNMNINTVSLVSQSYRTKELEEAICRGLHPEDCHTFQESIQFSIKAINDRFQNSLKNQEISIEELKSHSALFQKILLENMNSNFFKTYRKLFSQELNKQILLEFN